MPVDTVRIIGSDGASGAVFALVEADGSGSHPHVARLAGSAAATRDLADAIHVLCMLHGRHPGLIDYALDHTADPVARAWLTAAADSFAAGRHGLATLVAAVGPLPSTPGQAETEAAVTAQRHALDMLGQSDRVGCALGAAAALMLDWIALRPLFDQIARRFTTDAEPIAAPPPVETALILDTVGKATSAERALLFGAQQLLAQQRGLWDLLEARAAARDRL